VKVSEPEGALLDYWALRADGWEDSRPQDLQLSRGNDYCIAGVPQPLNCSEHWYRSPSTNWAHGGPILEREKLDLTPPAGLRLGWYAGRYDDGISLGGPTLLIAAMRAFVRIKVGREVPDSAD
jgi:hypothetical protein